MERQTNENGGKREVEGTQGLGGWEAPERGNPDPAPAYQRRASPQPTRVGPGEQGEIGTSSAKGVGDFTLHAALARWGSGPNCTVQGIPKGL